MLQKQREMPITYRPGDLVEGIYKGYAKHFGFLISEDCQKDVYIGKENRGEAMHNDRVEVEIISVDRRRGRCDGRVRRVVAHGNETIVGTFELAGRFATVTPDDDRIGTDVWIPLDGTANAKSGAKVSARITKWPEPQRMAEGVVEEVLGYEGDTGLDITLIIANHKIPTVFSEEALAEAEKIAQEQVVPQGRTDYRNQSVVTVDGADAKDLDDAVYCEELENGNFLLCVHIADVSYYVREGGALDKEAFRRGTSVYLADRVVPMLPEILSNGVCSLNEGADRYTMSVEMEVDKTGRVVRSHIGPGIIRSARRCTYDELKKALLENIYPTDLKPYLAMFRAWQRLAEQLIQMRQQRGALDFNFPEFKIMLDAKGRPINIIERERTIAERMIEQAMLLANETVAKYIQPEGRIAIFRVHGSPDLEKLQHVLTLMEALGVPCRLPEEVNSEDVRRLLEKARDHGIEKTAEVMVLRALPQAYYDIVNLGHFALSSNHYTHFTSPIRRYPDLVVHRLIREVAEGKRQRKIDVTRLERAALQSSMAERRAVEAERETMDLKRVEYMVPFVGEAFDATVTGITDFGIFVGLVNGAEGLIHADLIADGTGHFDERTYRYVDRQGGTLYTIGDEIRVTLIKADIEKRMLDFAPGEIRSWTDLEEWQRQLLRLGKAHRNNVKSDKGARQKKKKISKKKKDKHGKHARKRR